MINVNMVPNSDIPALHCSKGDGNERKFEVALHNNGKLIDASVVQKPLIFDAYAGGTEQIVGESESSAIVADISYPDEDRSAQNFLYRQSPSAEDGDAEITKIKGNSLVFNQKVWNDGEAELLKIKGNTVSFNQTLSLSNYFTQLFRATKSVSNRIATLTDNRTSSNTNFGGASLVEPFKNGDKIYVKFNIKNINVDDFYNIQFYLRDSATALVCASISYINTSGLKDILFSATRDGDQFAMNVYTNTATTGTTSNVVIEDIQVFNLTLMGLDTLTLAQVQEYFSKYFPLPYYNYTQGRLISFGGDKVNWNQLVQNGNFADTSVWSTYRCSLNVSNNIATITDTSGINGNIYTNASIAPKVVSGHKYYCTGEIKTSAIYNDAIRFRIGNSYKTFSSATGWVKRSAIITATIGSRDYIQYEVYAFENGSTLCKNLMCFDLTQMFGVGLEPTTPEEFEQWLINHNYTDDYYACNTGTVALFDEKIKTVGKNRLNVDNVQVGKAWNNQSNTARACTFMPVKPNTQYTISIESVNGSDGVFCACESSIGVQVNPSISFSLTSSVKTYTFTTSSDTVYLAVQVNKTSITKADYVGCNFQLEFGSIATAYEPYTEDALTIPTSQYFPDGMGKVHNPTDNTYIFDNLTSKRYEKSIGEIDMGDCPWTMLSGNIFRFSMPNKKVTGGRNALVCSAYPKSNSTDKADKSIWGEYATTNTDICVKDTSYSDAASFKAAVAGQKIQYALETPLVNYGVVDLGSINDWYRGTSSGVSYFRSQSLENITKPSAVGNVANIICPKYPTIATIGIASMANNTIMIWTNGDIYVRDDSIASADDFKSAMSGVYFLYELTTPASPTIDLKYDVQNGGTEQLLPENTATPTSAPLSAIIEYPDNTIDDEFLYKQIVRNIVLINGHSYITKINGTWSNVSGTGQTISVGDDDMVIDLTQMANPYITNYSQFVALYPDKYDFEKGVLRSFTGTGLKTVGKNLLPDNIWEQGSISGTTGQVTTSDTRIRTSTFINLVSGFSYVLSTKTNFQFYVFIYDNDGNYVERQPNDWSSNYTFSPQENIKLKIVAKKSGSGTITPSAINDADIQLEIGSTATAYESYKSSTLSLPTSTRFPTGMKSAGSAYDENDKDSYDVRMGMVDLGAQTWYAEGQTFFAIIEGLKANVYTASSLLCDCYVVSPTTLANMPDKTIRYYGNNNRVLIKDSSFTDVDSLKAYLSGHYLIYELATPVETDLVSAELTCEKGTAIAYGDENGLIIECNEQVSAQEGIFPAKIKLQEGEDINYSSLIKLAVEGKPDDSPAI